MISGTRVIDKNDLPKIIRRKVQIAKSMPDITYVLENLSIIIALLEVFEERLTELKEEFDERLEWELENAVDKTREELLDNFSSKLEDVRNELNAQLDELGDMSNV